MEKGVISVIIPIYNAEQYISECLDSLLVQTYQKLEIICVNDGSTDRSADILKKYSDKYPRVKVVTIENGGVSNARNIGQNYVNGEYIMYLDSDDWIDAETCEMSVKALEDNKADIVFWNYIREYENSSKPQYIYGKKDIVFNGNKEVDNLSRRLFGPISNELATPEKLDLMVTVWGKLYRSSLIIDNKLSFINTDEVVGEDLLFNINAFGFVNKAVYLSNCFNHYRKTNTSSFTMKYSPYFLKRLKNQYSYIDDYINQNQKGTKYIEAFNNRKSLNIVGIGMNILCANSSLNKYSEFKKIFLDIDFVKAIKTLELKYFPIHWKLFFFFVKQRVYLAVYLMLKCIRYLKNR